MNLDLFNLKVVRNDKEADFYINTITLSDILINKYQTFTTELPNYDGTKQSFNLKRRVINSYPYVSYNSGEKTERIVSPKYTTYLIYDDSDNVRGSLCLNKENTISHYTIDGEQVMLTSRTVGVPTTEVMVNKSESIVDDSVYLCDQVVSENQVDLNSLEDKKQRSSSIISTNNTYCVKILWEISWDMYEELNTTQNYTTQEYIEFRISMLNTIFNTNNNDSTIDFQISAIIEYETVADDPVNIATYPSCGNYGCLGNHINTVQSQVNSLYNNLYDFNISLKLQAMGLPGVDAYCYYNPNESGCEDRPTPPTGGFGTLWGVAVCGGIFNTLDRQNVCYINCAPDNLNINQQNLLLRNIGTMAHEVGHNFGLAHTFASACYTYINGQACITGCSDYPCDSVMSYCTYRTLEFHPLRITNMNNFLSLYGADLICSLTPNEPYLLLSITYTTLVSLNDTFTVQIKDCSNNTWYTVDTNVNYTSFPLYLLISDLPFTANCYEYLIQSEQNSVSCSGNITVTSAISNPPSLPPPSPTNDIISGINTIFIHYNNI
jgi:hypothetical protein